MDKVAVAIHCGLYWNTKLWPVNKRKQNYWHSNSNTVSATRTEAFRPPNSVFGGIPVNTDMDISVLFLLFLAVV